MLDKYDNVLTWFVVTLGTSPAALFDGVTNIVPQSVSGIKVTNMDGANLVALGHDNTVSLSTPKYCDIIHPQSIPLQLDRVGVGYAKNLWGVASANGTKVTVSVYS